MGSVSMSKLDMAAVHEQVQNDQEMILRNRAAQLAEKPVKGLSKAFLAYQKSRDKNQKYGPSEEDLKFTSYVQEAMERRQQTIMEHRRKKKLEEEQKAQERRRALEKGLTVYEQ